MRAMRHPWRSILAVAGLTGCVQSFARLDGVLVDAQPEARPVAAGESGRVEVSRAGQQQDGRASMPIKKGDALLTSADGVAVLVLQDGYQVIMDPGTDLTIENPSIFVRVGRIIVKKLRDIGEQLTVNTELGAAAVEGTEFVLEVSPHQRVRIAVLDGRVTVFPKGAARWSDTISYVAGEQGVLDSARAMRPERLSPRVTDSLRRRIREIETAVRPQVPDVVGSTEADARAELQRHGLVPVVVPVVTRQGRSGPEVGTVVATSPPAGGTIRQGARVSLSVEQRSVAVPDVMGQTFDAAVHMLEVAGLRLGDTTSNVQPSGTDGSVSGMAPTPGAFVLPGTKVSLTILRVATIGRVADTTRVRGVGRAIERVRQCPVPSIIGLASQPASDSLKSHGLGVGPVSHNPNDSGDTVIDQDPKAGTMAMCGGTVSITVGTPTPVIR